ncbi:MAG: O-antigen ligase family protein [candidate division FCPU426 bacterium]
MAQTSAPLVDPASLFARKLERAGVFTLGLILILLPLFFWLDTRDQFELPKVVLLRILSVVALGCYSAQLALSRRFTLRRTPLDLPILAWSLWLVVQTLHSVSPALSWRGEYENFAGSLTQLDYSLLFFAVTQWVRSTRRARVLLLAFELGALAVGTYAVFQALGLDFVAWSESSIAPGRYFSTMGNPNFLGALMVMALAAMGARIQANWTVKDLRIQGWALGSIPLAWLGFYLFFPPGHRLDLDALMAKAQTGALLTMAGYGVGFALALWLALRGKTVMAGRFMLGMEGLILFKALSDTATRGAFAGGLAMLGFFAALVLGAAWATHRFYKVLAVLAGLLAVLAASTLALGPQMRSRMAYTVLHPAKAFTESRMQIWGPALGMVKDYPLTGTGVDTFKSVFPQYSDSRFAHYDGANISSRTAHCEPLQILATLGLIGLALWLWLLLTLGRSWWTLWRGRNKSDLERAGVLAGLAALWIGYLVQNLVSFGVSGITAPFFMSMALLWSGGGAVEKEFSGLGWPKALALTLAGLAVAAGIWLAASTFRADRLYNFGHRVDSQLAALENMTLEDARGTAGYALSELQKDPKKLSKEEYEEGGLWFGRLQGAEPLLAAPGGSKDPNLVSLYRGSADSLLLLLSSIRQREAVELCPGEVKYRVYLGLAYEELARRSPKPELKIHWFQKAEGSYLESCRLNPRNAYYRGNLGRLYASRAASGDEAYAAKAIEQYLAAVHLAPSTPLFYENLLPIYVATHRTDEASALLTNLALREPAMAQQLTEALARLSSPTRSPSSRELRAPR